MNRNQELANRIREVFLNGTWIANTNFSKLAKSIDWKLARATTGKHNSIALLYFHVNYYLAGVLQVLQGGPLTISDKYSLDASPIESEKAWQQLVLELETNAENFALALEKLSREKLQEDFHDPKYGSYERNIEGLIEHSYYHLGQVSLLKKLLA
ncbi:MAG: DUF1572 domain-containing protein [Chitinophagales bacterium]|nr:DUF1572 domain-containing protein [Chitinophagales bacterium]